MFIIHPDSAYLRLTESVTGPDLERLAPLKTEIFACIRSFEPFFTIIIITLSAEYEIEGIYFKQQIHSFELVEFD